MHKQNACKLFKRSVLTDLHKLFTCIKMSLYGIHQSSGYVLNIRMNHNALKLVVFGDYESQELLLTAMVDIGSLHWAECLHVYGQLIIIHDSSRLSLI